MNIKYIGNFKDGTGWSKACVYNALSLSSSGENVDCEVIRYNKSDVDINPEINNLIDNKLDNYDIVINHCLPTEYKWNSSVKNVGFVALETRRLLNKLWIKKINLMDEIWVPNTQSQECLLNSGVNVPVKIFKHRFDYQSLINNKSTATLKELEYSYNFVFVGEFNSRKNIEVGLRAFYNEFESFENVNFLLKLNGNSQHIENFIKEVKSKTRKFSTLKNPIIINAYLDYFDLMAIVKKCHSFILPSHGEACCYPALESAALGLNVLYTEGIGIDNYIKGEKAIPIKSNTTKCYGANDAVAGLYFSDDMWQDISIDDLSEKMREVVNNNYKNEEDYSIYDYRSLDTKNTVEEILK